MTRHFYLINSKGQEWDLNQTLSFFHDPSGLGINKNDAHWQIGHIFPRVKNELRQPKPKGKIAFKSYEQYHHFARFIQYEPLRLKYITDDIHYMDCTIDSIGKTEKAHMGLVCPITFNGLSSFYKEIIRTNSGENTGKNYSYKYPYIYSDSKIGVLTLQVDSTALSGIKLHIFGPCTNPIWHHFVNGIKKSTGRLIGNIGDKCKLVIDTTMIPYSILEKDISNNPISDRYQQSDFSTDRFIFMEAGENIISVSHEGTSDTMVALEGRIYYDTV